MKPPSIKGIDKKRERGLHDEPDATILKIGASTFQAVVKGVSMAPTIPEGSNVTIQRHIDPKDLRVGDIILFGGPVSDKVVLHRLKKKFKNSFVAQGDGNLKEDPKYSYKSLVGCLRDVREQDDETLRYPRHCRWTSLIMRLPHPRLRRYAWHLARPFLFSNAPCRRPSLRTPSSKKIHGFFFEAFGQDYLVRRISDDMTMFCNRDEIAWIIACLNPERKPKTVPSISLERKSQIQFFLAERAD